MLLHVLEDVPRSADLESVSEKVSKQLEESIACKTREECIVKVIVRVGKPYQRIIQLALETQTDVVIMGVRGRGALDTAVFGSTTGRRRVCRRRETRPRQHGSCEGVRDRIGGPGEALTRFSDIEHRRRFGERREARQQAVDTPAKASSSVAGSAKSPRVSSAPSSFGSCCGVRVLRRKQYPLVQNSPVTSGSCLNEFESEYLRLGSEKPDCMTTAARY